MNVFDITNYNNSVEKTKFPYCIILWIQTFIFASMEHDNQCKKSISLIIFNSVVQFSKIKEINFSIETSKLVKGNVI